MQNKGKNRLAERNIQEATEMLKQLGDMYPIAVYQTYMADIYKDRGDLSRALNYAQQSLQLAEQEGLKEQMRILIRNCQSFT